MKREKDKEEQIAGCGCLFGVVTGIVFAVATIFSGDLKDPRAFLILIPLFALFCWSIPMTLFSSDRSLRVGTGCICYPVLIITFLVVYQEGGCEPVAWSVFAFIVLLILTGIVTGMVRKYRERKQ